MGFPRDRFLAEDMASEHICAICQDVVKEAASAPCCPEQTMCAECLATWVTSNQTCPIDQKPLAANKIVARSEIDTAICKLRVACEHTDCAWTGECGEFDGHIAICDAVPDGDHDSDGRDSAFDDSDDGQELADFSGTSAARRRFANMSLTQGLDMLSSVIGFTALQRVAGGAGGRDDDDDDDDMHTQGGWRSPTSSDEGGTGARGRNDSSDDESRDPLLQGAASNLPTQFTKTRPPASFAGIQNQGATCYLNSLLQSLFMTPEFRNAVYRWVPPENEDKEMSIPYQLARLFVLLQTSRRPVSTKQLTKSFGWDRSEAFEQHDVQELCRVLFDALEKKFQNTEQAKLINWLYQGSMKDFVRCKKCGYESARFDSYLDIPLVIRAFGSDKAVGSVEEALDNFVETETLEGDNQYHCDKCKEKVDAEKGLKFVSFPYLLTLQLKRFDFDYDTLRRIKLNDRVTFPLRLDLSRYVEGAVGEPGDESAESGAENGQGAANAEEAQAEANSAPAADGNGVPAEGSDGEAEDKPSYIYELFSIMIHSGSALGGHYYAYIRSFDDSRWYDFDDSSVQEISMEDIRKTYGGTSTGYGYSMRYSSSASGYMLFYRRLDAKRNEDFLRADEFPEHLKTMLLDDMEKERRRREAEELERNTIKVEVYFYDGNASERDKVDVNIHNSKTLEDLLEQARPLLGLDKKGIPASCCRFRKYAPWRDRQGDPFESHTTSLDKLGMRSYAHVLLETRPEGGDFPDIPTNTLFIRVAVIDKYGALQPAVRVPVAQDATLGDLRAQMAEAVGSDPRNVQLANIIYRDSIPQILFGDSHQLHRDLNVYGNDLLYAFSMPQPEALRIAEEREAAQLAELHKQIEECTIDDGSAGQQSGGNEAGEDEAAAEASDADADAPDKGSNKDDALAANSDMPDVTITNEDDEVMTALTAASDDEEDQESESSSLIGLTSYQKRELMQKAFLMTSVPAVISRAENTCTLRVYLPDEDHDKAEAGEGGHPVSVDMRISLLDFKERYLAPLVGLPSGEFKMFTTHYYSNQLVELTLLKENLRRSQLDGDSKIFLQRGRALQAGETRVELFLFKPDFEHGDVDEDKMFEALGHYLVREGQTVGELKKELAEYLKAEKKIDIPAERMRVREKNFCGPRTVYCDSQSFCKDDIRLYSRPTLCVQELPGPELKTDPAQLVLMVRHWRPSDFKLAPHREIVTVLEPTVGELQEQLAAMAKADGIAAWHGVVGRKEQDTETDDEGKESEDKAGEEEDGKPGQEGSPCDDGAATDKKDATSKDKQEEDEGMQEQEQTDATDNDGKTSKDGVEVVAANGVAEALTADRIAIAKIPYGYPDDTTGILDIQQLSWTREDRELNVWPLSLADGSCVYWCDALEPYKELTSAEKSDITKSDARKRTSYMSRGKERGLKITVAGAAGAEAEAGAAEEAPGAAAEAGAPSVTPSASSTEASSCANSTTTGTSTDSTGNSATTDNTQQA